MRSLLPTLLSLASLASLVPAAAIQLQTTCHTSFGSVKTTQYTTQSCPSAALSTVTKTTTTTEVQPVKTVTFLQTNTLTVPTTISTTTTIGAVSSTTTTITSTSLSSVTASTTITSYMNVGGAAPTKRDVQHHKSKSGDARKSKGGDARKTKSGDARKTTGKDHPNATSQPEVHCTVSPLHCKAPVATTTTTTFTHTQAASISTVTSTMSVTTAQITTSIATITTTSTSISTAVSIVGGTTTVSTTTSTVTATYSSFFIAASNDKGVSDGTTIGEHLEPRNEDGSEQYAYCYFNNGSSIFALDPSTGQLYDPAWGGIAHGTGENYIGAFYLTFDSAAAIATDDFPICDCAIDPFTLALSCNCGAGDDQLWSDEVNGWYVSDGQNDDPYLGSYGIPQDTYYSVTPVIQPILD